MKRTLATCVFLLLLRLPFFAPAQAAAQEQTVYLTVSVADEQGNPVAMALVNVYVEVIKGSRSLAVPPTRQDHTNSSGLAKFQIPVKAGQKLVFSLEVGREDMKTEYLDFDEGTAFATRMLKKLVLSPRATAGGREVINVTIPVASTEGPLEGGTVVILDTSLGTATGRFPGTTGADGNATIPVWFTAAGNLADSTSVRMEVSVSKSGYKDAKTTVNLKKSQIGKTLIGHTVVLEKAAAGSTKVTVTLTNKKNGQPVSEATVVLDGDGAAYYSDTTNSKGVATFYVSQLGGFDVRISHDEYLPLADKTRLLQGEGEKSLGLQIEPKAVKGQGNDTIEITVRGKDTTDEKSKSSPLLEAYVKAGSVAAATDVNGVAILTGAFEEKQEVTVQANGYKSRTRIVGVNKFLHNFAGNGKATFILDPEQSDSSPILLLVEVRDAAGKVIPKAHVDISTASGDYLTGGIVKEQGDFKFNSAEFDQELSVLRQGLKVTVKHGGFKKVESMIDPVLLLPATVWRRFSVTLERDWSELSEELTALEQRVKAWQQTKNAGISKTMESELIAKATGAREHAKQIWLEEISAGKEAQRIYDKKKKGETSSAWCEKATELKDDIELCDNQAKQKYEELKRYLDAASFTAANCTLAGDDEKIRSHYRAAIKLLGEIGVLNKKAVKDRDELLLLAQDSIVLKKLLEDMETKRAAIEADEKTAQDTETKVKQEYSRLNGLLKNLPAKRIALISEFSALKVKHDLDHVDLPPDLRNRVHTLESILNPTNDVSSLNASAAQEVPESIVSASNDISGFKADAETLIHRCRLAQCEINTMGEVVDKINETFEVASLEIGFAADLPEQADACLAKIGKKDEETVPDVSQAGDDPAALLAAAAPFAGTLIATNDPPPAGSTKLFSHQDPLPGTTAKLNKPLRIFLYQQVAEKPSPPPATGGDDDQIIVPDISKFKDPDAMLAGAGPDMVGMIIAVTKAPPPGTTSLFSHQDPAANTKSPRGKPLKIYIYQSLAEPSPSSPTAPPALANQPPASDGGQGTSSGTGEPKDDLIGNWAGVINIDGKRQEKMRLSINRQKDAYGVMFNGLPPVTGRLVGNRLVCSQVGGMLHYQWSFTASGDKLQVDLEVWASDSGQSTQSVTLHSTFSRQK